MSTGSSQEWYLEMDGKKTGPFSTEQVLGLLADQEIPDHQRITSQGLDGAWITVRELAQRQGGLAPRPKPFIPPPRPSDLSSSAPPGSPSAPPPSVAAPDPALGLLYALQVAKERKTHSSRALSPEAQEATPAPLALKTDRRKLWLLAGLGLILLSGAWGLTSYIKLKTPPTAEKAGIQGATPGDPTQNSPLNSMEEPPPPPPAPLPVGNSAAPAQARSYQPHSISPPPRPGAFMGNQPEAPPPLSHPEEAPPALPPPSDWQVTDGAGASPPGESYGGDSGFPPPPAPEGNQEMMGYPLEGMDAPPPPPPPPLE